MASNYVRNLINYSPYYFRTTALLSWDKCCPADTETPGKDPLQRFLVLCPLHHVLCHVTNNMTQRCKKRFSRLFLVIMTPIKDLITLYLRFVIPLTFIFRYKGIARLFDFVEVFEEGGVRFSRFDTVILKSPICSVIRDMKTPHPITPKV